MTTGGWFVMSLSVGFVTVLFVYCVCRVLFGHNPEHALGHVEPVHRDAADKD